MILESGAKVLVLHRRMYEGDHGRFFAGIVEGYESGVVRLCGHTWIHDEFRGLFLRKDAERTWVLSLASDAVLLCVLPSTADLRSLRFSIENGDLFVGDERGWRMELGECDPLGDTAFQRRNALENRSF